MSTGFTALVCLVGLTIITHSCVLGTRGNPASSRSTNATARLQKHPQSSDGACGSVNDLAKRVEVCAKPLMDMLQGTVEKWPRTDEDAMTLCDSFLGSERCIRDTSRKCGRGIQKTIISTLANSITRARKRECSRSKASSIVKTTMCLEKNQDVIHNWMSNVTGRLSAIELQTREGEKKINGVCCMVRDIEVEIRLILDPVCPTEGGLISRLYRAVLEDVIEIICRRPKCDDFLSGYRITNNPDFGGLISILLRIVFSLDNN